MTKKAIYTAIISAIRAAIKADGNVVPSIVATRVDMGDAFKPADCSAEVKRVLTLAVNDGQITDATAKVMSSQVNTLIKCDLNLLVDVCGLTQSLTRVYHLVNTAKAHKVGAIEADTIMRTKSKTKGGTKGSTKTIQKAKPTKAEPANADTYRERSVALAALNALNAHANVFGMDATNASRFQDAILTALAALNTVKK